MHQLLLWVGRLGGIVGVGVCALATLARLRGLYNLAGFQVGTLLLAGMALMVLGCLGYMAAVAERRNE